MNQYLVFPIGLALSLTSACGSQPNQDSNIQSSKVPYWFGSELRTHETFGSTDRALRVTWLAKPAPGNCAITLLSLYNGDRIFTTQQGHWSEIGFEIYGGSAGRPNYNAFQTQYITYDKPTDAATKRGRGHAIQHTVGGRVKNIWDGAFHEFQIEWLPGSTLAYRLDGIEIRREVGGDLPRLETDLKAYSSAWMGFYSGNHAWGCSDDSARPEATGLLMDSFTIEELNQGQWILRLDRHFTQKEEIDWSFDRSNWGFESFDGVYCPANAVWDETGVLKQELDQYCGPGRP
jgi:hypothetical protein